MDRAKPQAAWSTLVKANTLRRWRMVCPLPNADNDCFAKAHPPEQEFDLQKGSDGLGAEVSWEDYSGNGSYLDRESSILAVVQRLILKR